MSATVDLVLLTTRYPFGFGSETYLESEIDVLADRFRRVYVLPSYRDEGMRPLPQGVELVEMDWLIGFSPRAKRAALASAPALRALIAMGAARVDPWPYFRRRRMYLDVLAQNILKFRSLAEFIRRRRLEDAVAYDYWFENSTLALAFLRQSGHVRTAVSRAHNFDLYDERWGGSPIPYREAKARWLDAIYPVSEFGARYFTSKVPHAAGRVTVHRLGVPDPGAATPPSRGEPPLVVTCARLVPEKRIHLVPEVLARVGAPVRWVHLGDGPERARVEQALEAQNGAVAGELLGQVTNEEVLSFYARTPVTAFLCLSSSEGLPVSMMEAQSYGVPIVACAVSGVPEIVNDDTGILLPADAPVDQVAQAVAAAVEPERFSPGAVRASFLERFTAAVNYNRFVDELIALHNR